MTALVVADDLVSLGQRGERVVPYFQARAQRIEQEQRRRAGPQRVLTPQLCIFRRD